MGANAGKFLLTRKSALLADIVRDRHTDRRTVRTGDGREVGTSTWTSVHFYGWCGGCLLEVILFFSLII